jgi:hypothetical protein
MDGGVAISKSLSVGRSISLIRNVNGGATILVSNANAGSAAWSQYVMQNDTNNVASLMYNSSVRSSEGGAGALTLRNDGGPVRVSISGTQVARFSSLQTSFDDVPVYITSTTSSTSLSDGALIISGGAVVSETLRVGGKMTMYGSTSGNITLKAPAVTTSWTMTPPDGPPPVSNAPLIADLSGNLSWGAPLASAGSTSGTIVNTFHGLNTQTTPVSINGLAFAGGRFLVYVRVQVEATEFLVGDYELRGVYDGTEWHMIVNSFKDETGVEFSIGASTGQVQYTTPTYAGFTDLIFSWEGEINSNTTVNRLELGEPLTMALASNEGAYLTVASPALSFIDSVTASGNTAARWDGVMMHGPTIGANSTSVTTTMASTCTIRGPPVAGSHQTLTTPVSLRIEAGPTLLEDTSDTCLQVSGGVTVAKGLDVGTTLVTASLQVDSTDLVSGFHFGSESVGASASQSIAIAFTFTSTLPSTAYCLTGSVVTTTATPSNTISPIWAVSFSDLTTTGAIANIMRMDAATGWADTNVRLCYQLMH